MSDFDKEAEREKLRKKFADDEEKRASTQRMSELLLKGATMTNKHCDRCGDPLFRYDGQTFCPTCQAEGAAAEPQPEANGAEPQAEPTEEQSTQPQDSQPQDPQPQAPRSQGSTADSQTTEPAQSTQPRAEQSRSRSRQPASSVDRQRDKTGSAGVADRPTASTGDLTEARQSLQRTVTRFARLAEETDDPRRARELLAAAREAAATLAELNCATV